MQLTGLADTCGAKYASPAGPKILFIFAADEAFKLDSPNHDPRRIRIEADNAEIDLIAAIQNADFGMLRRGLAFEWLPLRKVRNRSGLLPEWIVKRAIELRRPVYPACAGGSDGLLRSRWTF